VTGGADALFINFPFVKYDERGRFCTGPNAGSRWPWTTVGKTIYAPFPFYLAYAVSYLRHHGIDAELYDAVALKHWNYGRVRAEIARVNPKTVFIDVSTPVFRLIRDNARWIKEQLGARVVMVGPTCTPTTASFSRSRLLIIA